MSMRQEIVLIDIDGTLSDCRHRLHYLEENPRNWDRFFAPEELAQDWPNHALLTLMQILVHARIQVILLTGRMERHRKPTLDWLYQQGADFSSLVMRDNKDYRPDYLYKTEFVQALGPSRILLAIDDQPHIVHQFRHMGVVALLMGEGGKVNAPIPSFKPHEVDRS